MKTFLIRGVPPSLQRDGWWMDGPLRRRPKRDSETAPVPEAWLRPLLLVALIVLADFLLWGAGPGLALALFGMAVLLVGLVLNHMRGWGGVILGMALSLPLIEQVQTLSLAFWILGILTGGAWVALGGWPGLRIASVAAIRLIAYAALLPVADLIGMSRKAGISPAPRDIVVKAALGWALPLGLGLIFASLLIEANPIVANWAHELDAVSVPTFSRVLFWGGVAVLVWPFLKLGTLRERLTLTPAAPFIGPHYRPAVLNPISVRNSLILFNALFAVQTLLDATYLVGGAALPEGMSYASYAHRGAYPLLATALLAGGFALIARPFTELDTWLRVALLIWIGQTVLLVASSLLRLDLYVEAYGLTRLRLAAGVWMGVVALGLVLTLWQVMRHHSAAWLLKRGVLLGLATLYTCMFLSFDRTIARYNLTHQAQPDAHYICSLSRAALPEIRRYAPDLCLYYHGANKTILMNWREWGFRDWRVLRSLEAVNAEAANRTSNSIRDDI